MRLALVGLMLVAATLSASAETAPRADGGDTARAGETATDKSACAWPAGVERCARIATPDKRLECFDELTGHGE